MHVGFEIENQVHHEDPQSKKHEQPRVASADSTPFRFGLARGVRQPEATQAKPPCPYLTTSPISTEKDAQSRRFLLTSRPISYIMLTRKSG
jgi:hypothetical protein